MKRVAVYCRVSTDKEDQANSFESQKKYFIDFIENHPDWKLTAIYADEGISGTTTTKRRDFNRMIKAAGVHSFDLIITKEVSRFARNTLDTLQYTRDLKKMGIGVWFVNDNINTLEADAELRLTIMSSIAQEESRKTSERVKWGQKRRMEQGVVFGRDMLGYDVCGGKLYINEEGAEIIRMIFRKFAEEGKGAWSIAREFEEAGIGTPHHMVKWTHTNILRILRNEKYCGDLIQKKTITPDYLSHSKKYNHGEEELVVCRNHHEPIVSRELFEQAQEELRKRAPLPEVRARYSKRYCLSGKIVCGCCGSRFVSRSKTKKDGGVSLAWRCYEATRYGFPHTGENGKRLGCEIFSQIQDDVFMKLVKETLSRVPADKERVVKELTELLKETADGREAIASTDTGKLQHKLQAIKDKQERLLDLYVSEEVTAESFRNMTEKYEQERRKFEKQLSAFREDTEVIANSQKKVNASAGQRIRKIMMGEEQNDTFYRNVLERIVVKNQDEILLYLSCYPHPWICHRVKKESP